MNKPFISLEEYLLLKDPTDKEPRRPAHNIYRTPEQWLRFYEIAKASYDKYGDEGPALGSKVVTLVHGHGGSMGVVGILDRVMERDPRFFLLLRKVRRDAYHGGSEYDTQESMVIREQWWNEIRVYDESWILRIGRGIYWQQQGEWGNVWLTAMRYPTEEAAKTAAIEVGRHPKFPSYPVLADNAEAWWDNNLRG